MIILKMIIMYLVFTPFVFTNHSRKWFFVFIVLVVADGICSYAFLYDTKEWETIMIVTVAMNAFMALLSIPMWIRHMLLKQKQEQEEKNKGITLSK